MNARFADVEAISAKISNYVQGCQRGDDRSLKEAFHADARMFGGLGDDRYDMAIFPDMSAAVAANPTIDHDTKVLSIDVEGDAACVKLAESRFWGQDFMDFFLLSRIDGEWQIVAKCFSHAGESTR